MMQSDTIGNLATALAAFQWSAESAKKNAQNPHLKNKYADLGAIWEAVRDTLGDNGLAVVQLPMPSEPGTLKLRTQLLHKSGEWIASELVMPIAKQDPQGYGSALTYARRYALAAMLGVTQEDDDAAAATHRPSAPSPAVKASPASNDQKAKIALEMERVGWAKEDGVAYLAKQFGKQSRADLTKDEATKMIDFLLTLEAAPKEKSA